ncbi:fumarylacetoacetase [Roseomonas alkaliterrae]|uniref:fumarylacetoacetase n=1 Tax=Neoroseomonas alkaliterrae TaxID=1452450 RepID=A0A840XUC3_9PROT|nr:fumarylacetoacetase [Neoroseomonas alkaliterrae]MBB5690249.1 fumarylacetoacetase [Neoroseomonas alkaliterrae]MBR0676512.1 fumarylacetoacetase [Neoroseomonas alkaliterrae]
MAARDATHDPALRSWVASANEAGTDFPIQNLPLGIFDRPGETPRAGVAIGDAVLDLRAAKEAGLIAGEAAEAACEPALNRLMALGRSASAALRRQVSALLAEGAAAASLADRILVPMHEARMRLPARVANFSDFMASYDHCARLGVRRDPKNPLPQAFRNLPVAYHSRASSVRVSGEPVVRPNGQWQRQDGTVHFGPSEALDYELELAIWIAGENALGEPVPMARAPERIFGYGLLNDWSARDIQRWEMPPLGPFLAKSLSTSVSPWIVTAEALAPFEVPAPPQDPPALPYLDSAWNRTNGALSIRMRAAILTPAMRAAGAAPFVLTETQFAAMYWTAAAMVTHHASNGCNLLPGDLLGSGTVSGPEDTARACLAEIGLTGAVTLPNGETRRWLEDGDEVIFTARAEAPGAVPIGFGECRAVIAPAPAWPQE